MAGKGRQFTFHGAFGTKAGAKRKERSVGGFIKRTKIRRKTRWLVLKRKKG